MNFGSGFLENDDVDVLRRLAVKLDLDPWDATPEDFRRNYPHDFRESWVPHWRKLEWCDFCRTPKAAPAHQGES